MQLFYQPLLTDGTTYLDEEESRHCVKVLRRKLGDEIHVIDGNGGWYNAKITNADSKKCEFSVLNKVQHTHPPFYIHIVIAPTKNTDRIEWFVEKSVEIGIQEISFAICKQSERKFFKTDRVAKKAISAMKQSLKPFLPKINPPLALPEVFKQISQDFDRFIAYVDNQNPDKLMKIAPTSGKYCVLIGPEGDFSIEELNMAIAEGFKKVSLGTSRLRTETAGIAACHILNLINE